MFNQYNRVVFPKPNAFFLRACLSCCFLDTTALLPVPQFWFMLIPSGKHTKRYWTWPFIVDLPVKKLWFSIVLTFTRGYPYQSRTVQLQALQVMPRCCRKGAAERSGRWEIASLHPVHGPPPARMQTFFDANAWFVWINHPSSLFYTANVRYC